MASINYACKRVQSKNMGVDKFCADICFEKIFGAALHGLQAVLIDALTLADTIAYILRKSLVDPILKPMSNWVLLLMKKIMQVLGRKVPEKEEELTHDLMRHALTRIMEKTTEEAKKAIQNI